MKLYKVLAEDRRSCHGGTVVWEPGVWMPMVYAVIPCERGYHLCRPQDLIYWFGAAIWEAEGRGVCVESDTKVVYSEARITRRLTQWTPTVRSLFAADCAERVLYLYERRYPGDDRPRRAIAAARTLPAARPARADASYDAADAARDAFRAAAYDAASYAARDAARAAADAARDAAYGDAAAAYAAAHAAAYASYAAARDAAYGDAERAWQTERLWQYLEEP